ncbi:MAG: hypothetical protein ACHQNA_02190 [Acidimicrobiales bacterium]
MLIAAAALYGCASSSSKAATAKAGANTSLTTVKATSGGAFCTKVADSINNGVSKAASLAQSGGGADALKAQLQQARQEEQDALAGAPGAIKSDLQTIVDASNKIYDALASANYDFSKLDPATFASFNTPALQTATQNVTDYVKQHCGIDLGGVTSTAAP